LLIEHYPYKNNGIAVEIIYYFNLNYLSYYYSLIKMIRM